ncbi:hypothetical protein RHSIM_RhsimUnG0015200 [Rhododendron simsii]|uniref:t-SNARE coiled-coil homology domain-containing protein n=1 Tax=Rhododendron simsii TaxID=118357 RepID=A0A834G3J3_RHOSS|nr:hypothetical protein RHSIM_RhsimUnG0015200 [Rhododendron simsii]
MSSAQDPFYIVKEEIQESIDKVLSSFHQWERIPAGSQEQQNLTKDLNLSCESIEWQVDELDKAIAVAARDPSYYGIDQAELDKRRRWTSTARTQVGNVKKTVVAGRMLDGTSSSNVNGMRRELMRMPNSHQGGRSNQYAAPNNDDIVSSESDRQLLLIKQQDEELDELSASVERIGGVGLTIHEELLAQEKIIDELGTEMESTSNRLDFVQVIVSTQILDRIKKGGYGDEEGWGQGTDDDDIILGCAFHCSVCSGLPHLGQRGRNQSAIAYTRKRVLRIRSNVGLDEGV